MKKVLLVLMVLVLTAPAFGTGWSVTATRPAADEVAVTVTPSTGATWNDLKIPCGKNDVAGDFSVDSPADWAVDSVVSGTGGRNYVYLTYDNLSSSLGGSQTITVTGPTGRTGTGGYIVTLNGDSVYSGGRAAAFCSSGVNIEAVAEGAEVTINYVNGEPGHIRAFALNVSVDSGATITPGTFNVDYNVCPGSFSYDPGTGDVNYGSPIADAVKYNETDYPGSNTLDGIHGMTLEMGSLYVGDNNAPPDAGVVCTFTVDKSCCVTLEENAARGGVGSDGVVMEDPAEEPAVTLDGVCANLCDGEITGDTWVNSQDVVKLVNHLIDHGGFLRAIERGTTYWVEEYNFVDDDWLNSQDLVKLLNYIIDNGGFLRAVECPGPGMD